MVGIWMGQENGINFTDTVIFQAGKQDILADVLAAAAPAIE